MNKGSFSRRALFLVRCPWSMSIDAFASPIEHRILLRLYIYLLCTLGRVELDDDATDNAAGLRIDAYGDECGEWFSGKGARRDLKLGKDSPV